MMLFGKNCFVPRRSHELTSASPVWLKPILVLAVVALVVWMEMSPSAWGQCSWEQLYTFTGYAAEDLFGHSVSGAGDVNNDGYDDLIVGAYLNDVGGVDGGRAYVYSGLDGSLLWTFTSEAAGDAFGLSVSGAGDVNNDGYDDLIVGAYLNDAGGDEAGRAYVYSGQTGGLLWTFTGTAIGDQLGFSVSGAGDVNNDGYDDLIVGVPYSNAAGVNSGQAYVYSGQSGALLWTFTGEAASDWFGISVSEAGDVNKDGYDDLFVGARGNDAGATDAGRAYVYSGQSGALLWTFTGEAAGDYFGRSVSGGGDVNNDSYVDLIVGAYLNDAGGNEAGRAYVYSGQTGGLLWTFTGAAAGDRFGLSVSGAGDVNNDGHDDLIVGAYHNDAGGYNAGRAYIYSGFNGLILNTFTGKAVEDAFGVSVSSAGDVNNDGFADLIVGAEENDVGGSYSGQAYVYSGHTGVYCFLGESAGDQLRWVSGAGDVNNDGHDDLIVGAPDNDAGGANAGRAYVYSGLTAGLLWTFTGEAQGDWLGRSVSGGDVNNDGYDDLIVGVPWNDAGGSKAGRAYVYSGLNGGLLWTFTGAAAEDEFGWSASGAGDVNNDGYDDLIVGAFKNDAGGAGAGRAYVYSGLNGGLLWTFTGEAEGDSFGWRVSGAGDVNNDGYEDLIVGAPGNDAGGARAGRAYVYSGLSGGLLWTFTGEAEYNWLGVSVSGAGDVNNDGYDDLIVGAPSAGDNWQGRAYLYSGYTGDLLRTFTGEAAEDYFGFSVSGAGDVNNDGYDDLIVGAIWNDAGGTDAGRAYVYGGRTGAILCTYTGEAAGDYFGFSVSDAGDIDSDNFDEVIIGAEYNDAGGSDAGKAYVYSCQVNDPFPPNIVSTTPAQNEMNVPVNTNISVTFDIDMDQTTINQSTFVANAWSTGLHLGSISYNAATKTATLDPLENFDEGEIVTVVLTTDIQSSTGAPLENSYVWSFTTDVSDGSPGVFSPPTNWEAGDGPFCIFCADLDGDKDLDLAVVNTNSDDVSILMNNGDGTFQSTVNYGTEDYPVSVFCADLDGDGDMDLAVANRFSNNVSILKNNGDGTFPSKVDYAVGNEPLFVFCADLDGDADLDLAVANEYYGKVSILKNNGDGTFPSKVDYTVGLVPNSLFCADLDGDYDLDIAVANSYSDNVSILKNNGDGTLQSKVDYTTGETPLIIFCADLDGDTDLDLAVANWTSDDVSVLKNNGDGTFETKVNYGTGHHPDAIFCADLDGDADLDLAVANYDGNSVSILENNGDGTFPTKVDYGVVNGPSSVFCADLDDDLDLDLAVANYDSDSVSILFNGLFLRGDANGDGIINVGDVVYLVSYLYRGGPAPDPLWVGDCNCDGIINVGDIVYLVSYLYRGGPPPDCP